MRTTDINRSVCLSCPHSEINQPGFKGGACACTIDPQRRDIKERAKAGDCEYFALEAKPTPAMPIVATANKPRPSPTPIGAAKWALAATFGKWAKPGEAAERSEICAECDLSRLDEKGRYCSICGCGTFHEDKAITNLAAYEENLGGFPGYTVKLPEYGCKHPKRGKPVDLSKPDGKKYGWPLPVIS